MATLRILRSCRPRAQLEIKLVRYSSSSSAALVRVRDVPAPNCGSIRILSLNRPEARNAISRQLLQELRTHVDEVAAQKHGETRALILASESDACFCAGADLKERRSFTEQDTAEFLKNLRGALASIEALRIPTISAVASTAFGGGLELALTTTLRVFSSASTVALPETRLAIIPGAGGTYRLRRIIGERRAMDLILTGRRITGAEAYFLGLANRLVEVTEEDLKQEGVARQKTLDEAVRLAKEICEGGPIAIEAALEAIKGDAEEAENAAYQKVVVTQDRNEALLAFKEKQRPVFKGR